MIPNAFPNVLGSPLRRLSLVLTLTVLLSFVSLSLGSCMDYGSDAVLFSCGECECCHTHGDQDVPITMDCSNKSLVEVPSILRDTENNITKRVSELLLNNNNIQRLEREAFAGLEDAYISFMYLDYNNISFIDNYTFNGLKFDFLDLSHNALTIAGIQQDAFAECSVPGTLDMSYNQLSRPPAQLSKLKVLSTLLLQHNPMGPILYNDTLKGYHPTISSIDLSACQLEYIQPNTFKGLNNLKKLLLDSNYFIMLNSSFFEGALIQDQLSLQNCSIQNMERQTFRPLQFVKTVNLNYNNFTSRPSRNSFTGFLCVNLYMRNCKINWITRGFLRVQVNEILDLSNNNIEVIQQESFRGLLAVKKLVLTNCNIKEIRGRPFEDNGRLHETLEELYLDQNNLDNTNLQFLYLNNSFFPRLHILELSHNKFTELPNLKSMPLLLEFYATHGKLRRIKADDFSNAIIRSLELADNPDLEEIHEDALLPLINLTSIDLTYSNLAILPKLHALKDLRDLHLSHSSLKYLPEDLCEQVPFLTVLLADHNKLTSIPDLANCSYLSLTFFDFNQITSIGKNTFRDLILLTTIQLHDNRIEYVHEEAFHGMRSLQFLHLSSNSIPGFPSGFFKNLTRLRVIDLRRNRITTLPNGLFYDCIYLEKLYLDENDIYTVGNSIFAANMTFLTALNISNNARMTQFPFPELGFPFLHELGMVNLPKVFDVPTINQIPRIQYVNFTYPYHCCIFKDYIPNEILVTINVVQKEDETPYEDPEVYFEVIHTTAPPLTLPPHVIDGHLFPDHQDPYNPNDHNIPEQEYREVLERFAAQWNATLRILPNNDVDFVVTDHDGNVVVLSPVERETLDFLNAIIPSFSGADEVICYPQSNPLMPCESLLDPNSLRVLVWLIWFPTVLGNIAVLFVTLASGEKLSGPQFVQCNLAFADFLLGVYLAFLAIVDIRTFGGGGFFKSALNWQTGEGCKAAGFIAVFGSELSILSLFIITLERLQTIAYSFSRGRFKMRHLVAMVIAAWVIALVIATLPLVGINGYDSVAVCLPFSVYLMKDRLYLAGIFTLNMLVFLFILGSYIHILVIFFRSPAADNSKKERLVLSCKMGALVFTNLITWFPLTIIGIAAILNYYIIDLTTAKFLVVLIFPFSSCINPFLYGILTKQFWMRARKICKKTDRKLQSVNNSVRYSFRRNSIASSDTQSTFRTHSPRCDIDMDMLNRRQSRRSFSVQLASSGPQTPPMVSSHPAPFMGRRNSSPAIFGLDHNGHNLIMSRPIGHRLPSDPMLPYLKEEPEEMASPPPRSPGEMHRSLSIVKEETEFNGSSDEESDPEEDRERTGVQEGASLPLPRSSSDPEIRSTRLMELPSRRGLHDLVPRHQVADMRPQQGSVLHRLTTSYEPADETHFHALPAHPFQPGGKGASPSHTHPTGRIIDSTDFSSTTTDSNSVGRRESVIVVGVNLHTARLSKNILKEQTDV